MDKDNGVRLERLYEECSAYFDGIYAPDRKVDVYGDGDPRAKIVMVGEAPGEQETLLGRPFVGKAGKNLDEFLELTGLRRAEMYITNVVKFRPVKISEKGRASNRPPTKEEIALFLPWLKRELDILRPQVIVTLGNVPLKALMGAQVNIGDVHGVAAECSGMTVFPMYHPASLIYNPSLKPVYAADMAKLAEMINN